MSRARLRAHDGASALYSVQGEMMAPETPRSSRRLQFLHGMMVYVMSAEKDAGPGVELGSELEREIAACRVAPDDDVGRGRA